MKYKAKKVKLKRIINKIDDNVSILDALFHCIKNKVECYKGVNIIKFFNRCKYKTREKI